MRRLSLTILRGWPAVGLLVMRVSVAAAIVYRRPASHPVELCAALLLVGGAWTTAAAALIAILELWRTVLESGGWVSVQLSAMAVALALVGPGIWSIDGWFFGWRRIDIPAPRREEGSGHRPAPQDSEAGRQPARSCRARPEEPGEAPPPG